MKITGKKGSRRLELKDGYSIRLVEKSYKAGLKAGRQFADPACVLFFDGCPESFAAGYEDGLDFTARLLFVDRVLSRPSKAKCKELKLF